VISLKESMVLKDFFQLCGIENNEYRYHYLVLKEEQFKSAFIGFMKALGFDEDSKLNVASSFVSEDKWGKEIEISINKVQDECWHFENYQYDVDVFYGKKHIILLIRLKRASKRADELSRRRLSRALLRWSKFVPVKKINRGKS